MFTGIALASAVPVMVAARRRDRRLMVRRFIVSALAVGVFCGLIEANSERLVGQCIAAKQVDCFDYGTTGIQVVAVTAYGFTALLKAWLLRDE